jgi:opacity protein-like surface antigen
MPRGNYGSNHYESVNTSHYEVADDSREKSENYRSELSFVIPLEIGIGRIEEITDMRQAIFIVEALVDAGRISRAPSEEEMRDFAELISELKNERFFDSRLRRIKELKVIDSFLKDNSLLAENDATYFSTLTDIWDFGREFIRSSGFRAGLVVSGGHRIEYYRNTNDYSRFSSRVNDSNIEAGIRFSWEIPVSLSWQHSFYSSFYFNRHSVNNKDEDPYSKNVTSLNGIDVNLSHTIGYYPNTRTNLILTYGGRYNVRKYTCANCDYLKPDSKQLSLNIHAGVYYYVSSQIGISGSYSYYHSQNGKDTDSSYLFKDTNHSFSVGMSYSIF